MKKWLITGASSGFGRLLAERVATNGDHVIAVARREDRLRELAADHDSVTPLVVDLTAPDVEQRLGTAIDAAGGLDILVNNAGYGLFSSVEQTPDSEARCVRHEPVCPLGRTEGSTAKFANESRKGLAALVNARRGCLARVGCLLRQ
jgi:NAD(P)-dependent dehydrogenase (short-subunit alcohol dehydrogenase family)